MPTKRERRRQHLDDARSSTERLPGVDGPDPIQARPVVTTHPLVGPDGAVIRPKGAILRSARVERAARPDITDTAAMERGPGGRRRQRTIEGWRVIDPLQRLHDKNPAEITSEHLTAANRLRDDYETAQGAAGIGSGGGSGKGDGDKTQGMLDAAARYRDAIQAVGTRLCAVMLPVVLSGWTVADLIRHTPDANPHRMQGRLCAALDRLAEHYAPPARASASILPFLMDPAIADVPQNRLGRVEKLVDESL